MRNYSSTAVATTLASAISSSDTSMTLSAATGLPSVPFTLVLDPDSANEEIVTVTARSGTSVSAMSRGQESTTARSHASGVAVKHMVTGRDLQDAQDHIANTTTAHGVTGAVVGTTNSQTLTNKAISGSANTLTNIAQASVTNLVTDLSNKAASSHTHTLANVTDVTASAAEVNILDGVTASTAELNYVDGVTSAIQTQLDAKAPLAGPTFTGTVTLPSTTSIGSVDSTELGYLNGTTSNVQTQLDAKFATPGAWSTYTPVAKSGSTTLTSGSGTGYYTQIGKTVICYIVDGQYGSTFAENLTLSLPIAAASTGGGGWGTGYVTYQVASAGVTVWNTAAVSVSGTTSPIVTFYRTDVQQTYSGGSYSNLLTTFGSSTMVSGSLLKYCTVIYQAA